MEGDVWLFLPAGMLSIIASDVEQGTYVARARRRRHLEIYLPNHDIAELPHRDYKYRCFITQQVFTELMVKLSFKVNYFNFKSSIHEFKYQDVCHDIWHRMIEYQHENQKPIECEKCHNLFYLDANEAHESEGMQTSVFGSRCHYCISGIERPYGQRHGYISRE